MTMIAITLGVLLATALIVLVDDPVPEIDWSLKKDEFEW